MMDSTNERTYPWGRLVLDSTSSMGMKYESSVISRINEWVKRDGLCLDVGAHQGFYTTLLSKIVGEKVIVHAFEPHPDNFRLLVENIKNNNCNNVRAHNEALGNEVGTTIMHEWTGKFASVRGHLGRRRHNSGADIQIAITKIDALVFEKPIDFIKIDVEWWESEVLKGASATINRDRPIMLIETHDDINEKFVRIFAENNSFELEKISEKNQMNKTFLLKPRTGGL